MRRLAAEPLVHFLLIGALLFAGLGVVKSWQRPVVRIEAGDLDQLAVYWEAQMQRRPDKAELAGIISDRINEELMAREAMRLGLGKDDMIIRRRLAQKMAFAAEDLDAVAQPDEATLRAYYARTAARYAGAPRVSFHQVFYSGDRPNGGAARAATLALDKAEDDKREPSGDPFLFPLTYDDVAARDLTRDYGPGFVHLLETATVGQWAGPVLSPYGWHIVKVSARRQPPATTFESVRDQVREAYLVERRAQANAAFLRDLRKRYRVVIAGAPEP
jgi:hypothetical protein